jgi:quinol monooxygenase YgiN
MFISRRNFIAGAGVATVAAAIPTHLLLPGTTNMYGLIEKLKALLGQRDVLIAILLEGIGEMPGCLSNIIAHDPADPNAIWITEVWDSQESYKASLSLPAVQRAISRGKPLIAGFCERFETKPIGGQGLNKHS